MNKVQQGFTLIELMIVVAIIGILAAIALPAYQDYTVRSKMTEPLAALSMAKTAVAEYYASEGALPADSNAAGVSEDGYGTYIDGLVVEDGVITLTITGTNIDDLDDTTVTFTPTEDEDSKTLTWVCAPDSADNNKYFPANCRAAAEEEEEEAEE